MTSTEWLSIGHLLWSAVLVVVAIPAWMFEKARRLSKHRAETALDAEIARGTVPLRTLGQDQLRGSELE